MTALSWSVLVIGAALTLLLFAFVVRRLIGVHVPALRTLPALWFVILGAVIALLAGMVFLVIAEALVPSGSVPGPVYVLRATRGQMGRAGAATDKEPRRAREEASDG